MDQAHEVAKHTYRHIVLRGTAYEVGAAQGNLLKEVPGAKQFFASGASIPHRTQAAETMNLLRRFSPAVEEEITGFCDALEIPVADLVYCATTHLQPQHCSHLVALAPVTANGHILMGRNYDFSPTMDDMRLCSTHITGKPAHIGFSSLLFGRQEGMNEHGLGVTASVGGMPVGLMEGLRPPLANGFQFWAQVRAILEECKTVSEAQALFEEMPNSGNPILLIADASGAAVIAEGYGTHKVVRPVEADWAVATNHFVAEEMRPHNPFVRRHSQTRSYLAGQYLEQNCGQVTPAGLRQLLGAPYPHGLACPYYEEFFGSLYGVVFDLTNICCDVVFGFPAANPWHTFRLGQEQPGEYEASLPMERAAPEFWEQVP